MPSTSTLAAPPLSIRNAKATLESSVTNDTRVLVVEWEITNGTHAQNGEWVVEWDSMYAALSADLNSARSEKGSYFALQYSSTASSQSHTPNVTLSPQQRAEAAWQDRQLGGPEDLPTAPLSTAKLLQFENGLDKLDTGDDLPGFFAARPIVQAPTHVHGGEGKREALFLLTGTTKTPTAINILFYPTWTPPVVLGTVDVLNVDVGTHAHARWAHYRQTDLKTLEDIARELEREGARGLGTGRVKVGVEGGGMDEEAVRREGWMVGEEMAWVTETFLSAPTSTTTTPLAQTALKMGLKLATDTATNNTNATACFPPQHDSPLDEDGEDLFALPLSPRSPDMAKSPFSRFRGDALGPNLSKLSMVETLDGDEESEKEKTPTGMGGLGLGLGILGEEGGFPPTPPAERKGKE